MEINIIYEDNHLLVVEKPVNILSQADETGDEDLLTLLKKDIKTRYQKPGEVYLGLVHRLDRPVGGVMVFAKTSKCASRLSEQIRNKTFQKTYLAVVHGQMERSGERLVHYLLKDTGTNTVSSVEKETPGSKEAILDYQVLETKKNMSLVQIQLHTGRSHQIRVQLSTIGHPLFGDQKYGSKVNKPGQQIALWASSVMLVHPTQKIEQTFSSIPPAAPPWSEFQNL